ncbi:hypothetical protein D4764_21G0005790 [Takifugu flavidus]|uniref:Uncharacterized protein n=1 Tax=Takifugu flavidus TaxID=433684 RepID=A0A5C6NGE4_9TELE|nr:hypothetical protein D4764_21G0005790 [Takifugu flavidus]
MEARKEGRKAPERTRERTSTRTHERNGELSSRSDAAAESAELRQLRTPARDPESTQVGQRQTTARRRREEEEEEVAVVLMEGVEGKREVGFGSSSYSSITSLNSKVGLFLLV